MEITGVSCRGKECFSFLFHIMALSRIRSDWYTARRHFDGRFLDAWWQQIGNVRMHAQNYINNGKLPGKSAAT